MAIRAKQSPLVNTVNIKSVNGVSLLGSGDLTISGGAGALDDLTDVTITTPSTGQSLSYDGTVWVNSTPATGVTDHGLLTGLSDDDHPQYYNQVRGDARYSQLVHNHTLSQVSDWPVTVTAAEVAYLDGVTSAIQPQLSAKVPTTGATTCSFTAGTVGTSVDWSANIKQERTVVANTTFTFTATSGRANLNLFLDITVPSIITWPANVVWAIGTTQPSASGKYNVAFYYNGTNYYGAVVAF